MKLAAVNPRLDFNLDDLFAKEVNIAYNSRKSHFFFLFIIIIIYSWGTKQIKRYINFIKTFLLLTIFFKKNNTDVSK